LDDELEIQHKADLMTFAQYKQKLKNNNTLDSSIDGGIPCTVFSENGS
tara:strand:+ start:345 stop:488 length:144 start_codon:yes stop_codon:yes gene_type:complete